MVKIEGSLNCPHKGQGSKTGVQTIIERGGFFHNGIKKQRDLNLKIIFGKQGERLIPLTAFSGPHLFEAKLNFSLKTRPFMSKESSNQDICEIANSNDVRGQ